MYRLNSPVPARSHPTYLITVAGASLAPASPDFQRSPPPIPRALHAETDTYTKERSSRKRRIRIVGRATFERLGCESGTVSVNPRPVLAGIKRRPMGLGLGSHRFILRKMYIM